MNDRELSLLLGNIRPTRERIKRYHVWIRQGGETFIVNWGERQLSLCCYQLALWAGDRSLPLTEETVDRVSDVLHRRFGGPDFA